MARTEITTDEHGKKIRVYYNEHGAFLHSEQVKATRNDLIKMSAADILRAARNEAGVSAQYVGDRIGTTARYIYNTESSNDKVSYEKINEIVDALPLEEGRPDLFKRTAKESKDATGKAKEMLREAANTGELEFYEVANARLDLLFEGKPLTYDEKVAMVETVYQMRAAGYTDRLKKEDK